MSTVALLRDVATEVARQPGAGPGLRAAIELLLAELGPAQPPPANEPQEVQPVRMVEPQPAKLSIRRDSDGEVRAFGAEGVPGSQGAASTLNDVLNWHLRRKLHPAALDVLAFVSRVHLLEEALADSVRQLQEWEAAAVRNGWSL